MNSKLRLEIARAYISVDIVAMLAICVVVLWFNLIAGIICILVVAAVWLFHRYVTEKKILKKLAEYKGKVLQDREDMMESFSFGSPTFMVLAWAANFSQNSSYIASSTIMRLVHMQIWPWWK